jgi:hypothetical protein
LDEVEAIVRGFGDARVHSSINCVSISCPDLRPEAYEPDLLDSQLDEQFHLWMANTAKGLSLAAKDLTLTLSPIFLWFAGDFKASGGVLPFIQRYAPPDAAAFIAQHGSAIKVNHFTYNWDLV